LLHEKPNPRIVDFFLLQLAFAVNLLDHLVLPVRLFFNELCLVESQRLVVPVGDGLKDSFSLSESLLSE